MYKATRELIAARQPHASYRMEVVKVKQIGGGAAGQAELNALRMLNNGFANGILSGWLVAPFNKELGLTAITSHYWNFKDGECFDTTSGVPGDYEYVIDRDLQQYYVDHHLELEHPVSMSLFSKDGVYHLVDAVHGDACDFGAVSKLTTEALFDRKSKLYQFHHYLHGGRVANR